MTLSDWRLWSQRDSRNRRRYTEVNTLTENAYAASVAARCGELRALKLLPSDVKLPALFQFLFAGAISVLRLDYLKRSATMATVPAEPDLGPILPGLFAELKAQQSS